MCMSLFGESMCVCATKKTKKLLILKNQIFKRNGQALLLTVFTKLSPENMSQGFYSELSCSLCTKDMCNHPPCLAPTSSWRNSALSCSTEYLRYFGLCQGEAVVKFILPGLNFSQKEQLHENEFSI